ncbi:T9SS-dependent choice-of-anchor J family protein [Bizionia sp. M204]|uniref:T9SS-dependent choice-of-anchor J family protein n=1 Tax=Bizionia sp. M204 TaxID=2675331 RepID=UPI0020BFE10C|nr:choice-of-anchor J domain-containing protein [Bizionia sp. M204]
MKKITLLLTICLTISFSAKAQLFSDDFEDQDISDWTLLDEDGDGFNFIAYDPSIAQNGINNYMSSESWNPTPGALFPNNYAISPAIDVTNNIDMVLNYSVGGADPDYSAEVYTVYVSTGNTIADFMNPAITVSFNEDLGNDAAAAGAFVNRSLNLSALDGSSTIYIAFRHHDVSDQFILNFDDVSLVGTLLSTDEFALNSMFIGCKDKVVTIYNLQGEANYRILNIAGQEVLNGNTRLESQNIDAGNLASGIYIVEVTDANSNAQKRKKIVIE